MTRKDLEQATQALADGALDQAGYEQLQEELKTNAESRDFFRRSMEIEMLLVEAMGQRVAPDRRLGRMDTLLHTRRRRDMTRALLATAAVLIITGVVMALVTLTQANKPSLACFPIPGTEWRVMGESSEPIAGKRKVTEGSTVRVVSGAVQLEFDSGMVMLARGPAEVTFPQLNRPVVKHGWLWIDSEKSSDQIQVETPHTLIRDIGTRFGVRVREDGLAEVHLVDGVVEVISKRKKEEKLTLKPKDKGTLIRSLGKPSEIPLEPDPFPTLQALLATQINYRTTVMSQGPAGYWRLEGESKQQLSNEIAGKKIGRRGNTTSSQAPGVGSDKSWRGFPEGNQSILMQGDDLTSVLIDLDVPYGVSREEGAVTFWIRRPDTDMREEILWLAGEADSSAASIPTKSIMHTQLSAAGQIEFLIENGEFDILLSSNFSITDGRWHHISATWGASAVELYVDGRRVQRVDDFGILRKGTMRGRFVRFGKPSQDLAKQNKKPFSGWVDEIALWNRPLTGIEIAHQIRAARGTAQDK